MRSVTAFVVAVMAARRHRWWVALSLAAALLVGLAGCRPMPPEREVVLGLIVPLTHSPRLAGRVTLEGAEMAVETINARGGVSLEGGSHKLRLVVEDNEDRPELSVSKAFKLLEADGAVALLGVPLSHNAIAVARVARANGVPMISTLSTHPDTTRDNPWTFRLAFLDTYQGRLMADFAIDDLEATRAAVLVDAGSPYSRSLGEAFAAAAARRGATVGAFELYTRDRPDLGPQLDRILATRPDVLFLPNYARFVPEQARQARLRGIGATLLGADAWDLVPPDERGPLEDSYYCDVWSPDLPDPATEEFVRRFRDVYGQAPSTAAALAFDTVTVVAAALESAGTADRDTLRQALATMPELRGVTGRIRLRPSGDPQRSAVIKRVTGTGEAVFFRRVDP